MHAFIIYACSNAHLKIPEQYTLYEIAHNYAIMMLFSHFLSQIKATDVNLKIKFSTYFNQLGYFSLSAWQIKFFFSKTGKLHFKTVKWLTAFY